MAICDSGGRASSGTDPLGKEAIWTFSSKLVHGPVMCCSSMDALYSL